MGTPVGRSCNHKVTAPGVCQQLSVMFNLLRFECTGPPTLFLFSSYNWVRCLGHGWKGRDRVELPYTANINNNNSNNEETPQESD